VASAVSFVAALGDLARFENPRWLMAYLGLVPSEHSSGERIRRGGLTAMRWWSATLPLVDRSYVYDEG
jgi:transposase